jgi:hypothetical protein
MSTVFILWEELTWRFPWELWDDRNVNTAGLLEPQAEASEGHPRPPLLPTPGSVRTSR